MKKLILIALILPLFFTAWAGPALSEGERVALTQGDTLKDDVVVMVKAPIKWTGKSLRPDIPYEIRKLRRNDTIIYDSDKDGSPPLTCILVMVVPKENEAELLARIAADKSMTLITPEKEITEAADFPSLNALKVAVLDFISTEGK